MKSLRVMTAVLLVLSMTVTAGAAFVPSIEIKDAPAVVEKVEESTGNVVVAEFIDKKDNSTENVYAGTLTIVPLSSVKKEDTTASEETESKLISVEKELTAALALAKGEEVKIIDDSTENPEHSDKEITVSKEEAKILENLMKDVSKELNNAPIENIVITDVFTLEATEEVVQALEAQSEKGGKLSITITCQGITKDQEDIITIWQKDVKTGKWRKVEFKIDDNGYINLKLENLGEIVIFKDTEAAPEKDENKTSPDNNRTKEKNNNKNENANEKSYIKKNN